MGQGEKHRLCFPSLGLLGIPKDLRCTHPSDPTDQWDPGDGQMETPSPPSLPNSSLSPLILSHLFPPCVSFLWLVSVSLCGGKTQEPQLWSDWTFVDFGNDFVLFCSGFDPLEVIGKGIGFTVEWPLQQRVCICVLVFWGNRYRFASPWRMMWPHDVLVFR